ncbi:MAG: hypothetical protein OEZ48_00500 [Candidatus Bathyarchaeota archaeon]|nr:hypothetical protein [Candidatus Bathyarchaeota archaeon]
MSQLSSGEMYRFISDLSVAISGYHDLAGVRMFLIRIPDDTVSRLTEIADSQGMPFNDYLAEMLEQAVRAHKLDCSLKETVDLYERTMTEREAAEEAGRAEGPPISEAFERMLASKLGPEPRESEEREMLFRFLSELSKTPS